MLVSNWITLSMIFYITKTKNGDTGQRNYSIPKLNSHIFGESNIFLRIKEAEIGKVYNRLNKIRKVNWLL